MNPSDGMQENIKHLDESYGHRCWTVLWTSRCSWIGLSYWKLSLCWLTWCLFMTMVQMMHIIWSITCFCWCCWSRWCKHCGLNGGLVYEQGVQLEDNLDGVCNDVFFWCKIMSLMVMVMTKMMNNSVNMMATLMFNKLFIGEEK